IRQDIRGNNPHSTVERLRQHARIHVDNVNPFNRCATDISSDRNGASGIEESQRLTRTATDKECNILEPCDSLREDIANECLNGWLSIRNEFIRNFGVERELLGPQLHLTEHWLRFG